MMNARAIVSEYEVDSDSYDEYKSNRVRISGDSDSFEEFKGNRVRIRGGFGQLSCIQGESFPNQRWIRTAMMNTKPIVSETGVDSDSFDKFKGNQVRIWSDPQ